LKFGPSNGAIFIALPLLSWITGARRESNLTHGTPVPNSFSRFLSTPIGRPLPNGWGEQTGFMLQMDGTPACLSTCAIKNYIDEGRFMY
jgi:hypothetical protein